MRKALVVDDEKDIANLVQSHLAEMGFTAITAANGKDALAMIGADKPDLLVLDISMPEMDGLECLRRLRADPDTAALPVILLTAKDDLQDLLEGYAAGSDVYITKPFEKQLLVDAVQTLTGAP